ncbi:MAG: hypothetical protein LLG14_18455 [Nocardiaceae bacterium]|nr:hypothetical protein [Nocardiaceae bacterium]
MTFIENTPSMRQVAAARAIDALGGNRAEHTLLQVRCRSSHHVATVLNTDEGVVIESFTGQHAHGRKDYIDEPHRASRLGTRFADLLDADQFIADEVPAACECGAWTLSRESLRHAIDTSEHVVVLP